MKDNLGIILFVVICILLLCLYFLFFMIKKSHNDSKEIKSLNNQIEEMRKEIVRQVEEYKTKLTKVEGTIDETNKLKNKVDTGNTKSDIDACNDILSDLSKKRSRKSKD